MEIADYERVLDLWRNSPGIGLSAADEPEAIERYLQRNPGLSATAWEDGQLVGAVLCGHDGRRGFIHHLAVAESHTKRGVGRRLVEGCLERLAQHGIQKCHIFVYGDNQEAIEFWRRIGWQPRQELILMSRDIENHG